MASTSHATAATTPPTPPPTASTAPPQRQSCDRCHKQKLRCTRDNNSNGGVCDRCLRRRVQCVYSFSLPKGRPSMYRLADNSTTGSSTRGTASSRAAHEPVKPTAVSSDADTDASTKMNIDAIQVASTSTSEHFVAAGLVDKSMNVPTGTWSPLETLNWDDTQLEVDWSSHDASNVDSVLASIDAFRDDKSPREGPDPPSPNQPVCPPSPCHPHAYAHGQPGGGIFDKYDSSTRSNIDRSIGGGGGSDGMLNMSPDNYVSWPSLIIAQLSQLSACLSSLRYSCWTLAEAAESSSCHLPNGRQIPLIDAAAFELVAAWLTHSHASAKMDPHPIVHAETHGPFASPTPETRLRGGQGILHDVFSTSHRLLEILRHLQVKNIVEPFNSSVYPSIQISQFEASD